MRLTALTTALILNAGPVLAEAHATKMNAIVSGPGGVAGAVTVTPTPSGQMLIEIDLTGVPEGAHGVHIHETGDCSAGDFTSAGGHLAGDADHGILTEGGPHPGDLPNAVAGMDGALRVNYFNDRLSMEMLNDDDGSAFIVHAGADDYESQPAGAAGDRIACGVIQMAD